MQELSHSTVYTMAHLCLQALQNTSMELTTVVLKRLFSSVLSLLFLFYTLAGTAAIAQESKSVKNDNTDQEAQEKKILETRTLALLDNVAASTPNLKLPENRVRAEANLARLYWSRDPERAKGIFRQMANDLVAMASQISQDDSDFMQNLQAVSQLRIETVQSIIPVDPKAALEFLRATKIPFLESQPGARTYPLELQLQAASVLA